MSLARTATHCVSAKPMRYGDYERLYTSLRGHGERKCLCPFGHMGYTLFRAHR